MYQKLYKNRFADTDQRQQVWHTLVTHFFQRYIDKNDTVLDIPCGYCEFINSIRCRKKIAVDLNPDAKKYKAKDVQFIQASSTKIPLSNNSVDIIFISNFFEHLTREDSKKTIKECYRILKNHGRILILQPNIRFCSKDYWMFFDHITPIDDRALEEVFALYKFRLQEKILKFLPFSTKSALPKHTIFIKTYLALPFLWRIFGKQSFLVFTK